jgi:hypothetical protein
MLYIAFYMKVICFIQYASNILFRPFIHVYITLLCLVYGKQQVLKSCTYWVFVHLGDTYWYYILIVPALVATQFYILLINFLPQFSTLLYARQTYFELRQTVFLWVFFIIYTDARYINHPTIGVSPWNLI